MWWTMWWILGWVFTVAAAYAIGFWIGREPAEAKDFKDELIQMFGGKPFK